MSVSHFLSSSLLLNQIFFVLLVLSTSILFDTHTFPFFFLELDS
jgi:hypothetical protein